MFIGENVPIHSGFGGSMSRPKSTVDGDGGRFWGAGSGNGSDAVMDEHGMYEG